MIFSLAGKVIDKIGDLVGEFVEDKDKANQIRAALHAQALGIVAAELDAQKSIIVAEAQGQGVLQRNWRPITMLCFVGLIVAHIFGFTAPNLTEGMILSLYDLVKIGLGGYVVGRSAEKIAPHFAKRE